MLPAAAVICLLAVMAAACVAVLNEQMKQLLATSENDSRYTRPEE